MLQRYVVWTGGLLCCLIACNRPDPSTGNHVFHAGGDHSGSGEAFEVIYALYLPTDISRLFEETGTSFNPGYPMPLERIPLYEHPGKLAILMGALGVDLSYCKLFEMPVESAECYAHIESLAEKLGLPGEIFETSPDQLEKYIDQPDSLTRLINDLYSEVDKVFRENNQESLASLALFGGWLEAMYIGVKIYIDHNIIEMGDRLLQQKYALNSLVGLLGNYQESLMVRRCIHPLNKLKTHYEGVEIIYSADGFRMEREERLFRGNVAEINCEPQTLENICRMILEIRSELIQ